MDGYNFNSRNGDSCGCADCGVDKTQIASSHEYEPMLIMNTKLATQPQQVQRGKVLLPEIHKAVQKWSNSFFRSSIPTNLTDKSVVTEINDERAKLLTAHYLYGERNGTTEEIPYNDSEISNRISDLKLESLWLYGGGLSKALKDFSEKSQAGFRIPTGNTKKCLQCLGAGQVDCLFCKGTGKCDSDKSKPCPHCKRGQKQCGHCNGYKYVQEVIEVKTRFKVQETKEHDYTGDIPPGKIKQTTGTVLFNEISEYPEDGMLDMLKGGINAQECKTLQTGVARVFHSLIEKKLQGYDGDINLLHGLVDKFLKQIPNALNESRVLEHELVPVRLRIMVEDLPVKKLSCTYKDKPYSLWIYGKEQKVYAKKRPLGFTGRLVVLWIIQLIIVGLLMYWFTGRPLNQVPSSPSPATAAAIEASEAPKSQVALPVARTPPGPSAIPFSLSPDLQEIVKLFEAGMHDEVITNFISHSGKSYNLRADDIIYLSTQGVSQGVIRALQNPSPGGVQGRH